MFRITSGVVNAAVRQASGILGKGIGSSANFPFGRMSSSTSNIAQVSGKNLVTFCAVQPSVQPFVPRSISSQLPNGSVNFDNPKVQMKFLEDLVSGQEMDQHVVDGMQNCDPRLWSFGDQEKIKEQLLELLADKPLTLNAAIALRFLNDLSEEDQNSLAKAMLREDSSYIHVDQAALKTVLRSLHIFDNPEIKARLIEGATAELDKANTDPEMLDVIMENVDGLTDNPRAQLSVAWAIWEGCFGDDQELFEAVGQKFTDPKAKLIIDLAIEKETFSLNNIDALKTRLSLHAFLG